MVTGTIIAGRFVLERTSRAGGMSTVFQALDLQTGKRVALKLLHHLWSTPKGAQRFAQEALVLSRLSHPHIVTYTAHGRTVTGQLFLAMEWLHGEDLAARLARQPLSLPETLTMARVATSALAFAHQRGVIHRDIKPSNLFLREGQVEQLVLLDFGLARQELEADPLTQTGAILGTPEYMSPEQARGQRDIGPTSDIFSLGCVLYECVTGQQPFAAKQISAQLAKLLWEELVPVSTLRPDVPRSLAALIEHILDKDPAKRPASGSVLLRELQLLEGDFPETRSRRPAPRREQPLRDDPRLLCVIMAREVSEQRQASTTLDDAQPDARPSRQSAVNDALTPLSGAGLTVQWLPDGALVVALSRRETATDLSSHAARVALCIQKCWPEALIALATGKGSITDQQPIGEALDRVAAFLLANAAIDSGDAPPRGSTGIMLDELTAALIDTRFCVERVKKHLFVLSGERDPFAQFRPILGRPTPCVGRGRELALLRSMYQESVDEQITRVALLVAQPGMGKSRLRHELVRTVLSQTQPPLVLMSSSDTLGSSKPFSALGQALRRMCGIAAHDSPRSARERFIERIGKHLPAAQRAQVTAALAEAAELPGFELSEPAVGRAGRESRGAAESIPQAALQLLAAETQRGPVLLVLEDFQWIDPAMVALVGTVMRELSSRPLMILAVARPEVHARLPNLWEEHGVHELRLEGLTRSACEELIGRVLGEPQSQPVAPALVDKILERAHGNALYLEEGLIGARKGASEGAPEALLALEQGRMMRLSAEACRVLRAASVFGPTFWRDGILAVLAPELSADRLDACLRLLATEELIIQQRTSRFPGTPEYRFRYTLQQEAAYALLGSSDRALAHLAALTYLEEAGESSPRVLAEHARSAADMKRAAAYYLRAAEQAILLPDFDAVLECTERGIECDTTRTLRSTLRSIQSRAYLQKGEYERAFVIGREILALEPTGSACWFSCISSMAVSVVSLGRSDWHGELLRHFDAAVPPVDKTHAYIEALGTFCGLCCNSGHVEQALRYMQLMQQIDPRLYEESAKLRGWLHSSSSWILCHVLNEPWRAYQATLDGLAAFSQGDNPALRDMVRLPVALTALELGKQAEAVDRLRDTVKSMRRIPIPLLQQRASAMLAWALSEAVGPAEASEITRLCESVSAAPFATAYPRGCAALALGLLRLAQGQLSAAENHVQEALSSLRETPLMLRRVYAALSAIYLRQGRIQQACEAAESGLKVSKQHGYSGEAEVTLLLGLCAAYAAGRKPQQYASTRAEVEELVQLRAARIPDEALRARYLATHAVPPMSAGALGSRTTGASGS